MYFTTAAQDKPDTIVFKYPMPDSPECGYSNEMNK